MDTELQQQISDYIEVFFKRKKLFFVPFFSILAIGAAAYPFLPRIYEASSLVLVDDNQIINPLIEGIAVRTEAEKKLKSLSAQILNWTNMLEMVKGLDLPREKMENAKGLEKMIMGMRERVEIKLITEDVVKITYEDEDPYVAMKVVNSVAASLAYKNLKLKKDESTHAIDFIGEQLRVYKDKLSNSERSFFLNRVSSELDEAYKRQRLLKDQLSQLEKTVVTEVIREQSPAVMDLKKELLQSESLLRQMLLNAKSDSPLVNELRLKIESLRRRIHLEEESRVSSETSATNPVYQEAVRQLKELELTINSLEKRRDDLRSGRSEVRSVSEQELMGMERDKRVNEDIYQSLLRRLENAYISQRLGDESQGGGFKVIDPARLPIKPVKPNPAKVLLMTIFCAFGAGLGTLVLREYFDTSFRSVEDAKKFLKLPILAYIPKILTRQEAEQLKIPLDNRERMPSRKSLVQRTLEKWNNRPRIELTHVASVIRHDAVSPFIVAFHDPESVPAEQYRLLRTHLLFMNNKKSLQTIMLTSTLESEGKSTTSVNLAVSMAGELNRRILLIDCDLRKGGVGKSLGLVNEKGLSEYLSGQANMESILHRCPVDGLTVIPSGKLVLNPTKILVLDRMNELMDQMRERFDFIIMDAPPVLNLADVPVLVPHADGIVMVTQAGETRREMVQSAQTSLEQNHRANVLGYVLTQVQHYVPSYIYQYIGGGR